MSSKKKEQATLPPKVAQFMKEAPKELKRIPELEKRAAAAEQAKTKVAELEKTASEQQERQTKMAATTADTLKELGLIATEGDHAKFATDLADPAKTHNLVRYLGKKLAAAEANSAVKPMGNPDRNGQGPKTAEEDETANDRFASRVRAAAGV